MKNIYLLLYYSLFLIPSSFAQGGIWTWMSGISSGVYTGVYGTKGVPSVNNHPPALYESVNWTDAQGNFWLYGGSDLTSGINYGDLWEYNPASNSWTWVFGTGLSDAAPDYGTKGIPSATNTPGCRGFGGTSWVDENGNLWMFGGWSYYFSGEMNDLWMYNVSSGEWTWMSGPTTDDGHGVYGTQGIPSINNFPSARIESPCFWQDTAYNFWLFGGELYGSNFEDVWKYTPSTNEWTWMNGDSISTTAVYGTEGVNGSANTPGGRDCYAHWVDKAGKFWLFGGNSNNGYRADLWRYDPVINEWAWMSGSTSNLSDGTYPQYCEADTSLFPVPRYENKCCWTDACGNFWMFGGFYLNDLWQYNPTTNTWLLISGSSISNSVGSYGTIRVPNVSNLPDARGGSSGFIDTKGNLWMFGGYSGPYTYGDLWEFVPDSACTGACSNTLQSPPSANFTSSNVELCANDCINFTNLSSNATSWQWRFAGALDSTSTAQNPQNVCYETAGVYNVTLIATNATASDTVTFSNYITVSPTPPTPVITQSHDSLFCSTSPSYTNYQWYNDSAIITAATDTFFVISQGGNYNVQVTNASGCSIAVGINIVLGIQNYSNNNIISIYPNPVSGMFTVYGLQLTVAHISIYNVLGQVVQRSPLSWVGVGGEANVSSLPSGIYFVRVVNESGSWVGRFVKE